MFFINGAYRVMKNFKLFFLVALVGSATIEAMEQAQTSSIWLDKVPTEIKKRIAESTSLGVATNGIRELSQDERFRDTINDEAFTQNLINELARRFTRRTTDDTQGNPVEVAIELRTPAAARWLARKVLLMLPRAQVRIALDRASDVGDLEKVRFILDTITQEDVLTAILSQAAPGLNIPIIAAAQNGFAPIVQRLIQAGARIDVTDQDQWNALMHATVKGNSDVVRLLLEHGRFNRELIDRVIGMAENAKRTEQQRAKAPEELEIYVDFIARMDSIINMLNEYEVKKKVL